MKNYENEKLDKSTNPNDAYNIIEGIFAEYEGCIDLRPNYTKLNLKAKSLMNHAIASDLINDYYVQKQLERLCNDIWDDVFNTNGIYRALTSIYPPKELFSHLEDGIIKSNKGDGLLVITRDEFFIGRDISSVPSLSHNDAISFFETPKMTYDEFYQKLFKKINDTDPYVIYVDELPDVFFTDLDRCINYYDIANAVNTIKEEIYEYDCILIANITEIGAPIAAGCYDTLGLFRTDLDDKNSLGYDIVLCKTNGIFGGPDEWVALTYNIACELEDSSHISHVRELSIENLVTNSICLSGTECDNILELCGKIAAGEYALSVNFSNAVEAAMDIRYEMVCNFIDNGLVCIDRPGTTNFIINLDWQYDGIYAYDIVDEICAKLNMFPGEASVPADMYAVCNDPEYSIFDNIDFKKSFRGVRINTASFTYSIGERRFDTNQIENICGTICEIISKNFADLNTALFGDDESSN